MTPVRLAHWGNKRTNKYGNRRFKTAAGVSFDSVSEQRRYQELQLLEKAGKICHLKLHPRYRLEVNGVHICDYIGDFRYQCWVDFPEVTGLVEVVEDRKAGAITQTAVFKLKRKLMLAIHGIDILITGEGN